jgi:hypothetical protein
MDVGPALIADGEAPVLVQPRQCSLHHPPVPAQLLARLYPLSSYPRLDSSLPQCLPAPSVVVALVRVQRLRSLPRPTSRTLDRLDGVYERFQQHRVVPVSTTQSCCERDALPVDHNVALRAGALWALPLSVGFGPVSAPPFWLEWWRYPDSPWSNLSGPLLPTGPTRLGAIAPILLLLASHGVFSSR